MLIILCAFFCISGIYNLIVDYKGNTCEGLLDLKELSKLTNEAIEKTFYEVCHSQVLLKFSLLSRENKGSNTLSIDYRLIIGSLAFFFVLIYDLRF